MSTLIKLFNSPAGGAGRLFPSPVSGVVPPAAQIAEGELVIEQVSQLSSQLAQKQNIIGPGGLSQDRVANLTSDLAGKADSASTSAALNAKADSSTLSNYVTSNAFGLALAVKADSADLNGLVTTSALNTSLTGKQDTIPDQGLAQSKVQNLSTDITAKASST